MGLTISHAYVSMFPRSQRRQCGAGLWDSIRAASLLRIGSSRAGWTSCMATPRITLADRDLPRQARPARVRRLRYDDEGIPGYEVYPGRPAPDVFRIGGPGYGRIGGLKIVPMHRRKM